MAPTVTPSQAKDEYIHLFPEKKNTSIEDACLAAVVQSVSYLSQWLHLNGLAPVCLR